MGGEFTYPPKWDPKTVLTTARSSFLHAIHRQLGASRPIKLTIFAFSSVGKSWQADGAPRIGGKSMPEAPKPDSKASCELALRVDLLVSLLSALLVASVSVLFCLFALVFRLCLVPPLCCFLFKLFACAGLVVGLCLSVLFAVVHVCLLYAWSGKCMLGNMERTHAAQTHESGQVEAESLCFLPRHSAHSACGEVWRFKPMHRMEAHCASKHLQSRYTVMGALLGEIDGPG